MKLKAGDQAPDFSLPDQDGKVHSLSDYRGREVLLYFYPKDDTPGCTTQACQIRDNFTSFKKLKTVVLGVSADSVASHQKFAKKFDLPFPLLADESKETIKAYGAWGEKSMYGKKYMGILRTSFLIDGEGNIEQIYEAVKPAVHAGQVLEDLGK